MEKIMTNPAHETNSNVEKLIAPYESKFSRLWERFDEACHGNSEHMRDMLEETLNELEGAESDIAVLTSALEQAQQKRKEIIDERTISINELSRIIHRETKLRKLAESKLAELEAAPNSMMQLSNELAEMKRKCAGLEHLQLSVRIPDGDARDDLVISITEEIAHLNRCVERYRKEEMTSTTQEMEQRILVQQIALSVLSIQSRSTTE